MSKDGIILLVQRALMVLGTLALLMCFTFVKPAAAQSPAFVRIIHASPDVGTADVFVDGKVFLNSFQFGAVTNYAAVPQGPHKVQIALVGKGIGASVMSEMLTVTPGVVYTVAAIGTKATGLSLEVFIDNNVVAGNAAKVRAYQLSPDAGGLSMSNGSSMLVNNLTYKQASDYFTVPATPSTCNINGGSLHNGLQVPTPLKAATVTSIFVVGLANGTPAIQLVSSSANGTPGMPGTGSDPNPLQSSQGPSPWMGVALAIALLGFAAVCLGKEITRQRARLRTRN